MTGQFVLHSFSEIKNEVKAVGKLQRATPGSRCISLSPARPSIPWPTVATSSRNLFVSRAHGAATPERARQISCAGIEHCDIASDLCADAASPVFPGPVNPAVCAGNNYAGMLTWRHTPDRLRKSIPRRRPNMHRWTHQHDLLSTRRKAAVTLVPSPTSLRSSRHRSRTAPLHHKRGRTLLRGSRQQGATMVEEEGYPVATILAQLEQRLRALEPGLGGRPKPFSGSCLCPRPR